MREGNLSLFRYLTSLCESNRFGDNLTLACLATMFELKIVVFADYCDDRYADRCDLFFGFCLFVGLVDLWVCCLWVGLSFCLLVCWNGSLSI